MREHARGLAEAKVSTPADKIRGEVFDDLFQALSPGPAGHIPDFHLELADGLGRDRRSAPSFVMVKPRNLRSSGCATALFASLTFSFSFWVRNLVTEAMTPHRPGGANIDVAVVCVPAKAVSTPAQFLIEIVEHEIAEERRKRTALRGPFIHRTDQTVFHHPGIQKRPDKSEHTLIGYQGSDARHQHVVIDPVEKLFEVQVDHDAITLRNVVLGLGNRLIGERPGRKP